MYYLSDNFLRTVREKERIMCKNNLLNHTHMC